MTSIRKQINNRMSLRKPQEEALSRLEALLNILPLTKEPTIDLHHTEQQLTRLFPRFETFERNFPNVCFALATGVGKTRLMGAMIAYLAEAKEMRNFVILAPNTTITEKLLREFANPTDPKYVFKGLPDFTLRTPRIVTGENYDEGMGLRKLSENEFNPESITINIFNIALLHAKDRKIRRLNENIEDAVSYFEWLASQKDLVVFMDEAHRYRAKSGTKTIEELKPILGIELTATAQVESSKGTIPFKNVIYSFTLPEALKSGYVKRLGIVGRSNFDCSTLPEEALEKLKLEDGLTIHRRLQVELWHYTHQNSLKDVKPFVLIIAKDTDHAHCLHEMIDSISFQEGRYRGKVLTVHSQIEGEEKEETIRQLLLVESPASPIEVVIHVNMLREGWDVNNLFTIIPLRRANSSTLIEQSLGRGSRLPFGKRTGYDLIDRLYVVYHDKFEKVVNEVGGNYQEIEEFDIGELPSEPPKQLIVHPGESLSASQATNNQNLNPDPKEPNNVLQGEIKPSLLIKIPRIIVQPDPYARMGKFSPFTLALKGFGPAPISSDVIAYDSEGEQEVFHAKSASYILQMNPEEKIAHALLDCDGVADTEENAAIVTDLSRQMVSHLQTYLTDEDIVKIVVHQNLDQLVQKIYEQMLIHYEPGEEKMIYSTGNGYVIFAPVYYLVKPEEPPQDYKIRIQDKRIESVLWSGFNKSVYPLLKFHSDAERRLACILESDPQIICWVKPPKDKFFIYYQKDAKYEPDFIVEAESGKFLCEVKDHTKLKDPRVLKKAAAATEWCKAANEVTDKKWQYLLIPDHVIELSSTFAAYASKYEWKTV